MKFGVKRNCKQLRPNREQVPLKLDHFMILNAIIYLQGEFHYENDELIEGGKRGRMVNGVKYREVRQFQTGTHLVRFYFVTRCYNTYMESILADFSKDPKPDVIIINSCLWDISRSDIIRYNKVHIALYEQNKNCNHFQTI